MFHRTPTVPLLPLSSVLYVLAFNGRRLRTTCAVSVCNVRCMTPEKEILSTPLLRTVLLFPLHPFSEHFLLHLLPSKCFRSPVSALRVITSPPDAHPSTFFHFAVQVILVDLNLFDIHLLLFVFMLPLLSRSPRTSSATSNVDIDPWRDGESKRLGNLGQIQSVDVEYRLQRVRCV